MKKTVSTEATPANIATLIAVLGATPNQLESLSKPFTNEQLCHPLGAGERSFVDVLAHLLNCEARSSEAIYLALLADEPWFVDIHPERQFGQLLRYDLLPVADLLAYFSVRRNVLGRVLAALAQDQWLCAIQQAGKKRKESVYRLARSLALHELAHLAELEDKLTMLVKLPA